MLSKLAIFIFFSLAEIFAQSVLPLISLHDTLSVDQDDMCIWIHPVTKSQSTIITSDKYARKLFVYDLQGNTLQQLSTPGNPGNIDIRYNFNLGGNLIDIVAFNDRTLSTIRLYKVDVASRMLIFLNSFDAGTWPSELYGFCLYKNLESGIFYAFGSGVSCQIRQWQLVDNGDGTIRGAELRTWVNNFAGAPTEGMVTDDETGMLFAANEATGVYKYNANLIVSDPVGELIIPTGINGIIADIEGLTIYYASGGSGYLILSSQGNNLYGVFERQSPHAFVKTFQVVGAIQTDGIDVSNLSFGPPFNNGIFALHNDNSNPKEVLLCDFATLGLSIDTEYWDPQINESSDYTLSISLSSFSAVPHKYYGSILLKWKTEAETENLGFTLERREYGRQGWLEIASYLSNNELAGHGSITIITEYAYEDISIELGNTYEYRLAHINFEGKKVYHNNVVNATVVDNYNQAAFILHPNYPNPFNDITHFNYDLLEEGVVSLIIYDSQGNKVKRVVECFQRAGQRGGPQKLDSGLGVNSGLI